MKTVSALINSLVLLLFSTNAEAIRASEDCTYSGLKYDPASPSRTQGKVNSVPDNFSGTVTCTDPKTKRIYETYTLLNGEYTGERKAFDRSTGKLEEITPYRAGKRHGCVTRFDSKSGHKTSEFCLENGEMHGLMKDFNSKSGTLERIKFYSNKGGKVVFGSEIGFNSKGEPTHLKCGPQTLIGEDDRWCGRGGKRGQVTLYFSDGGKRETRSFLDSTEDGPSYRFHAEGWVMELTQYQKGKVVERKTFKKGETQPTTEFKKVAGKSTETLFFEDAKTPRLITERDDHGLLKEVRFYANGKPHRSRVRESDGLFSIREFWDSGKLREEGKYREREGYFYSWPSPEGTVKRYDVDGKLLFQILYKNGVEDGEAQEFDPDGKVVERRFYVQGNLKWSEELNHKVGTTLRREFAEDGSVKSENLRKLLPTT